MTEPNEEKPPTISDPNVGFRVVFECATAIRTLSDVIANMLETVDVQVICEPDGFQGVKVESIDSKQVSLVIAQLRADVRIDNGLEKVTFCINTKTFNTCVRSTQSHFSISLETVPGSSSVRLTAFETLSNTSITRFVLPTLMSEFDAMQLKDMYYKYHIDMETATLKGIVRMCLALQGETLTFKIMQPAARALQRGKLLRGAGAADVATAAVVDEAVPGPADSRHKVLVISSNGSCEQEHTFYSLSEDSDDAAAVTATTMCSSADVGGARIDDDAFDVMYEERFGAKHLSEFLKAIDKNVVTLRMTRDKPLIVNHKFGLENSYVCLATAPQVDDDV
jgi:hypothetical protein